MKKTTTTVTFLALLLVSNVNASAGVSFGNIKDGETLSQEQEIVFKVEGMKVTKAGELKPNTGHHHLIIDEGPLEKGIMVQKDNQHLHFGNGQTHALVKLTPGKHTLTLQFADGHHMSYGPDWSKTITVYVK